ncbi:hypothetical protein [Kutzneria sp. CA-103260]|uniref:hypothetical protein n=1 Tax=Kutzneria sp. CA-103260 TaxID=2802641 RepID=UPI001BA999CB|nr:hypothetical protein [Kutzneria sp. CA-103260]QUQ64418.1 hypothetical protein JJ691_21380 [Kutzneria sp. CA-103260]
MPSLGWPPKRCPSQVVTSTPRPSVELLAEMMVGLVGGAARRVRRSSNPDPLAAGELATAFMMAAIGNLDGCALDAVDRAGGTVAR